VVDLLTRIQAEQIQVARRTKRELAEAEQQSTDKRILEAASISHDEKGGPAPMDQEQEQEEEEEKQKGKGKKPKLKRSKEPKDDDDDDDEEDEQPNKKKTRHGQNKPKRQTNAREEKMALERDKLTVLQRLAGSLSANTFEGRFQDVDSFLSAIGLADKSVLLKQKLELSTPLRLLAVDEDDLKDEALGLSTIAIKTWVRTLAPFRQQAA
jgi:hypothetical protein